MAWLIKAVINGVWEQDDQGWTSQEGIHTRIQKLAANYQSCNQRRKRKDDKNNRCGGNLRNAEHIQLVRTLGVWEPVDGSWSGVNWPCVEQQKLESSSLDQPGYRVASELDLVRCTLYASTALEACHHRVWSVIVVTSGWFFLSGNF